MKATKTIILVISLVLVLATTLAAADNGDFIPRPPVLDYKTGNPISSTNPFVIRAFWRGQHYYVERLDIFYIGLKLEPQPSRFVLFTPTEGSENQNVKANIPYYIKFNIGIGRFWGSGQYERIHERTSSQAGSDRFTIIETKENRVYKMNLSTFDFERGRSLVYSVGMKKVIMQNNVERYYLAAMRPIFQDGAWVSGAKADHHELRFTFEMS